MSLLADVLREREARLGATLAPAAGSRRKGLWPLAAALAAGVALAFAGSMRMQRGEALPEVPTLAVAAAPEPSSVLEAVEALPDELRLVFDRAPSWKTERTKRTLTLILAGTRLRENLGGFDATQLPLRSLHLEERSGELRVRLEPRGRVRPEAVMLEGPAHAEIRVRFERSLSPPAKVSAPPAAPEPDPAPPAVIRSERLAPAERAYRAGLAAQRVGDSARAEAELEAALAADPEHQGARLALTRARIESGRFADAEALIEEGRRRAPESEELALLEARLRVETGDLAGALAALERFAARAGPSAERDAFAAALHQRMGAHRESRRLYRRALGSDPAQARYWLGLAISLEAERERSLALEAYRRSLALPGLELASRRFAGERLQTLLAEAP